MAAAVKPNMMGQSLIASKLNLNHPDDFACEALKARDHPDYCKRYCDLISDAIDRGEGGNLYNINPSALAEENRVLHILRRASDSEILSICCTYEVPADKNTLVVSAVITPPEFRQRGFGRALILSVNSYAGQYGYSSLILVVRIFHDGLSVAPDRLYRSCGYEQTGAPLVVKVNWSFKMRHLFLDCRQDGTFETQPYTLKLYHDV